MENIILRNIPIDNTEKLSTIDVPGGRCVLKEQVSENDEKSMPHWEYYGDSLRISNASKDIIDFYERNGIYAVFEDKGDCYEPIGIFCPSSNQSDISKGELVWIKGGYGEDMKELLRKINTLTHKK